MTLVGGREFSGCTELIKVEDCILVVIQNATIQRNHEIRVLHESLPVMKA